MSLEELMNVEVTTVTRVPASTTEVPAAVHVITHDDIRRSGATSIPEALRLAPGIQVAHIDASRWSIGIRGFADRLARSMLVLIDGRAVYSPLFAGTYWEVQDTLLADVDRIEVIRGPGGTLWGANAVNGIINIITRRASETQGAFVSGTAGLQGLVLAGARYGGELGANGHYRVYGKGAWRGPQHHASGQDDHGDWRLTQAGFRGDWTYPSTRTFTLQGDVYDASLGQRASVTTFTPPFVDLLTRTAPLSGGNVLARWAGPTSPSAAYQLQTFYDRTNRDEIPVAESRDTFDVDFQHTSRAWARHAFVWGAAYRVTSGRITTVGPTSFTPPARTDQLVSAFLQDEITAVPNRVRVMVGTKLEHNDYSGVEIQPSARLVWTPDATHTVVWSVTRAVRTPSRVETDYTTNSLAVPALPAFVRLMPNPDFRPEKLVAYEVGYRVRPDPRLYVTASGFFNHLDDTLSTELLTPFVEATPPPPRVILPVTFANGLHGSSYGLELTTDVRPTDWWRWTANYSLLRVEMTRNEGGADVSQEGRYENLVPRHQVHVQSSIDVARDWQLDWVFRFVSELRQGPVPSYATSDIRVGWRMSDEMELSVVGRNLHEARHVEWPGDGDAVAIERSALVGLTWRR